MKQYTASARFFSPNLNIYIPAGAVFYRSDISSSLVITGINDGDNKNNFPLTSLVLSTAKEIAWFDSLIAKDYSALLTLNGTLAETVNGVGVQGPRGFQGFQGHA